MRYRSILLHELVDDSFTLHSGLQRKQGGRTVNMKTYCSVFATVCAVGGFVTSSQAFLQPPSILARECRPSHQRLAPCSGRAQIEPLDGRVLLFGAELCPANSEVEWKVTMQKICCRCMSEKVRMISHFAITTTAVRAGFS